MARKPMSLKTKILFAVFAVIAILVAITVGCYYSKQFSLGLLSIIISCFILWALSSLHLYLDNIYYFANDYRTQTKKQLRSIGVICKLIEISKPVAPAMPVVTYVILAKLM